MIQIKENMDSKSKINQQIVNTNNPEMDWFGLADITFEIKRNKSGQPLAIHLISKPETHFFGVK